ncbi:MAG: hypothetical protein JWM90_2018 [Thermoleophilia bacterium]|nr:hypothetical protein [Thermoleophilia bacterium]
MTDQQPPAIVFVEHVLWQPGEEWTLAVQHVADRFARAHPLDAAAVLAAPTLTDQLDALAAWAEGSGADLDRELGRWFDEHLSMHLRPNPAVTRAVRAIAAERPVHGCSALPPRVAEAIARHAGAWRSVAELHAPVRSTTALHAVIAASGATTVVAGDDQLVDPLPDGAERASLNSFAG